MDDWKDALAALGGTLPPGPADGPSPDETPADNESPAAAPKGFTVKMAVEKKGRGGKTATILWGFDGCDDAQVADVARKLKQRLGIGGSVRGGEILLQGDVRQKAAEALRALGFKTKG